MNIFGNSLIPGKQGPYPILLNVPTGRKKDKVHMSSFWKTTLSWLDVKIQTFHSFNYRRGLKFFNNRAKIMGPRQASIKL